MSKMVCLAGSGRAKRGLAMVPKWRTNKKREERCGACECQKWTCNESDQREEQYCGAQKTLHHTKKWWLLGAFLWDLRPQYASNKGLVRSFNSLWNSSKKDSPTIAPTLRHDWPGMQRCERRWRLNFFLKLTLLVLHTVTSIAFYSYNQGQLHNAFEETLSERIVQPLSLFVQFITSKLQRHTKDRILGESVERRWDAARRTVITASFSHAFEGDHLEQVEALLPWDMVASHMVRTS